MARRAKLEDRLTGCGWRGMCPSREEKCMYRRFFEISWFAELWSWWYRYKSGFGIGIGSEFEFQFGSLDSIEYPERGRERGGVTERWGGEI